MRTSIIPWHVFREALEWQESGSVENWLERWGFTNDGVVLINGEMRAESRARLSRIGAQQAGPCASTLGRRPSLQNLVEILTRDPVAVNIEPANQWPYKAL